eukprot:TRINITY_DN4260_c0_g2_i1.p1 TRINITY_DN4260_c0_g2~~TRINITY_DN4260_c0_g2_i1.p1  ORF type:complete len:3475 (-),score=1195.12 TRINITY_DN4260_c0_g2_i1:66-10490(-)
MFENIVASILSKYLGDYVEGLESKNLSLGIMGGKVKLENLRLKKEALADLEVPVVVKDGVLGSLELDIPWSSLGSKPAIARVSNVFLICGPSKPSEYDPEIVLKKTMETKKRRLQISEMFASEIASELEENKAASSTSQAQLSYTQSLINTIVDNFQLFIDDVHVRYEDDISHPGKPLAYGITLEKLHVQSTGADWQPKFITGHHELVYKLVEMTNFAMYLNSETSFLQYAGYQEMRMLMERLIWKDKRKLDHLNIINPIKGTLKLVLNKNDEPDMKQPKIVVDLLFKQLSVAIAEAQYNDFMHISSYFAYYMRGINYHEFRPNGRQRPTEDALPWWRFALRAVMRDVREKRERCTWESMKKFKERRLRYMELFKIKKGNTGVAITQPQLDELAALEEKLELEHIETFRNLAMASLGRDKRRMQKQEKEQKEQKAQGGGGWFGWVWSGGVAKTFEDVRQLSIEEWRELYEAIKFDVDAEELASESKLPKEYVKMKATFALERGSFVMQAPSAYASRAVLKGSDVILQAMFDGLAVEMSQRDTSLTMRGTMNTVRVMDHYTLGSSTPLPMIAMAEGGSDVNPSRLFSGDAEMTSMEHFMSFRFEQNPLDGGADVRVSLAALRSLNITVGRVLLDRLASFFVHTADTTQLRLASSNTLESLKEQAEISLKYAMDNRKKLDVLLEVVAPNVCVPRNFSEDDCAMLVLSLGRLMFRSNFDDIEKSVVRMEHTEEAERDVQVSEEFFYDAFDVRLTDICSYMTQRNADLCALEGRIPLIDPFDLLINLNVCTVPSAELANLKVSGSLPGLDVWISPKKIGQLLTVVDGFVDPDDPRMKKTPAVVEVVDDEEESALAEAQAELKILERQREDMSAINNKLVAVQFEIERITVRVCQVDEGDADASEREVVRVCLRHLQMSANQMSHETLVDLGLGTFAVDDYLMGNRRAIVSSEEAEAAAALAASGGAVGSPEDARLIAITYRGTPPDSPLFKQVEHRAEMQFNTLDVIVNRGTLLALLALANTITAEMDKGAKKPPAPEASSGKALTSGQSESSALDVRSNKSKRAAGSARGSGHGSGSHKSRTMSGASRGSGSFASSPSAAAATAAKPHTLFAVDIAVQRVGMTLNRSEKPFIYTGIRALAVKANVSTNSNVNAQGALGKVEVTDCTPDVMYPSILSCAGERVVDFSFALFNGKRPEKAKMGRGRTPREHEDGEMVVQLQVASVEAVFVNSFVMSALDYVQELNEMKVLLESARERASEAAMAVKDSAQQSTVLLVFDVSVANPHVIIPTSSRSQSHVVANLGDITIRNRIDAAGDKQYIDLTEISINALNVKTVRPDAAYQPSAPVILDTNIDLSASRAVVGNANGEFPDLVLDGKVSQIFVKLSEGQLECLLAILTGNLTEQGTKEKSEEFLRMQKEAYSKRWSQRDSLPSAAAAEEAATSAAESASPSNSASPDSEAASTSSAGDPAGKEMVVKKPRQLYQVNLELGQLGLEIASGVGWNENGDSTAVASFSIRNQEVFAAISSDDAIEARYMIKSIVLEDCRHNTDNKFRKLMSSVGDERGQRLLTASYAKESSGDQTVSLRIERPRLMLVPSLLWDVKTLGLQMSDTAMAALAERTKIVEEQQKGAGEVENGAGGAEAGSSDPPAGDELAIVPAEDVPAKPASEEPTAAPKIVANVFIDRPQLCLVESPEQQDSRGIVMTSVVKARAELIGSEQHAKVDVSGVQIYKCRLTSQDTTLVSIIAPFRLRAEYDHVPKKSMRVKGDVENIAVTFSYNDFKLLMGLQKSWMEVIGGAEEDPKKKAADVDEEGVSEEAETDAEEKAVEDGKAEEGSDATPAAGEDEVQEESHMLEVLLFSADGVDLQLLNDCYGGGGGANYNTPIAHFSIDSVGAELYNWSSRVSGDAHVKGLEADYYNSTRNVTEHMIEPWSVSLTLLKSQGMEVFIVAKERLSLNITRAFVETMLRAMEVWRVDFYDEAKTSRASHPFYIRNLSGMDCFYWLTGTSQKRALIHGAEEPLEILEQESAIRKSLSSSRDPASSFTNRQTISIDLPPPSSSIQPESLYNLPFNELASLCFQVGPQAYPSKVVYSVTFRAGSKLITVGSDLAVKNNTPNVVEVELRAPTASEASGSRSSKKRTAAETASGAASAALPERKYVGRVEPGEHCYIPVQYTRSEHMVHVRPVVEGKEYDWSSGRVACCEVGSKKLPRQLVCSGHSGHRAQWVCRLSEMGHRAEQDGRYVESQEMYIVLSSPLLLENRLPCTMQFKLVDLDDKEQEIMSGHIERGEDVRILDVSPEDQKVGISIAVAGFGFGPARKIQRRKEGKEFLIKELSDKQRPLSLRGDMMPNSKGVMTVTFFARHWILNQSGSTLRYAHDEKRVASSQQALQALDTVEVLDGAGDEAGGGATSAASLTQDGAGGNATGSAGTHMSLVAVPWMFSEPKLFMEMPDKSGWSANIGLGSPSGVVVLPGKDKDREYQLALTITTAPGKYVRTQVIRIMPRFIVVNTCSMPVEVCQQATHKDAVSPIKVYDGEQKAFDWPSQSEPHYAMVRPVGGGWKWSPRIDFEQVESNDIRIDHSEDASKHLLLRAAKRLDSGASIAVVLSELSDQAHASYRVKNDSSYEVSVWQRGCGGAISVMPHESQVFVWNDLIAPEKEIVVSACGGALEHHFSFDVLKKYSPMPVPARDAKEGAGHIGRNVDAAGPCKVLHLFDIADIDAYRARLKDEKEKAKAKRAMGEEELMGGGGGGGGSAVVEVTDDGEDGAEVQEAPEVVLKASLELAGVGVSVVDDTPRELLYLTLTAIELSFDEYVTERRAGISVKHMQIDNQLLGTPYPILFYSIPAPTKPFLQVNAVMDTQHSQIMFFKFCGVLLQGMEVNMDEMLLLSLLRFADVATSYMREQATAEAEKQIFREPASFQLTDASSRADDMMLYFRWLQINAIEVHLSFLTLGAGSQSNEGGGYLEAMLRTGGFLANIDNVPLRLNGLLFEHPFCSQGELISRITAHYTDAGMREVFKILGSADVLGSPVSLVNTLGTGVHDFFVEPSQATSPDELISGLAKGTTSLIKNSVYGVFNSVSKVTGSVSHAATSLSMDDEWQRERAKRARHQPKHLGQGIAHGARDFGMGFVKGITGVVSQPIRGAMEDGGMGFVSGMRKGVTGLVLKPVVGVVDTVTDITAGIKNTTTLFDENLRMPARKPRHFAEDGVLYRYDEDKAVGQLILRTLDEEAYANHFFEYYVPLDSARHLILSNKAVFYIGGVLAKGVEELKNRWYCEYKHMVSVDMSGKDVIVGQQKAGGDISITIPDDAVRETVLQLIAQGIRKQKTAVAEFNAQHREGEDLSSLVPDDAVEEEAAAGADGMEELMLEGVAGEGGPQQHASHVGGEDFEEVPLVQGYADRRSVNRKGRKDPGAPRDGAQRRGGNEDAARASESTPLVRKAKNVEDVGCWYNFTTGISSALYAVFCCGCCATSDDYY